jgi:hypothetical protein
MLVYRRGSGLDRRTLARRALLAAACSVGCTIVVGGDGSDTDNTAADSSGAPATGGSSSTDSPTTTTGTTTAVPTAADESSSTTTGTTTTGTTTADGTTTDTPTGPTGGDCDPGRVDFDRPDDHEGAYQVHVNYVLPSDGVDEQLDLDDRIVTSVASFNAWLAAQADGRRLRLDTCDGALDIRFVRLSQSEATLRAEGVFIRDAIEAEMMAAGQISATKLELVYYGGDADSTCGGGPYPPNLIGRVGALYLKGTFDDPNIPPCASSPVGASLDQPGYVDFSALHELLHALGLAPGCAPHHTLQGHVSDSPQDLMYAGAEPWTPSILDLGKDDYLDHEIPDCPDLGRSVFLEPLPVDATPPPGW